MKAIFLIATLLGTFSFAEAMIVNSVLLKKQSSFIKNKKQRLFDFLDLNLKSVRFTRQDILKCRRTLVRKKESLQYSCTMEIPGISKTSQLSRHQSSSIMNVSVGLRLKEVNIQLAKDAKTVKFSTRIEETGVDFDEAEFNADLHNVLSNSAHQFIAKAMQKKLVFKVLEN